MLQNEVLSVCETSPPIAGFLYNCALNCALPAILNHINQLASLTQEESDQTPNIANYHLLKRYFESWYGLPCALTWTEFSLLIQQFQFSEIEFILAPVLREFLAHQASLNGEDHNLLKDIVDDPLLLIPEDLKEFFASSDEALGYASPGRYFALQNHEAERYFYNPLGLTMVVHNYNQPQQAYLLESTPTEGMTPIDVYLRGGHYEMQPHENIKHAPSGLRHDVLETAREAISSNMSRFVTNRSLASLIPFVRQTVSELLMQTESQSFSCQAYYAIAVENKLHNGSPDGQLTFVVILLLLMHDQVDKKGFASEYLEKFQGNLDPAAFQKYVSDVIQVVETDLLPSSEPMISREVFQNTLNQYQTSHVFYHFLCWLFGCGKMSASGTMLALHHLLDNDPQQSSFTKQDIATAINDMNNMDSRKQHRFLLFTTDRECVDRSTGTDMVLDNLKLKFI
jgi:hypothetical protein